SECGRSPPGSLLRPDQKAPIGLRAFPEGSSGVDQRPFCNAQQQYPIALEPSRATSDSRPGRPPVRYTQKESRNLVGANAVGSGFLKLWPRSLVKITDRAVRLQRARP